MTQEWMIKTLENLNFKTLYAEVYVLLALNGPKKAKNIADTLKTNKRQVYRILKELHRREIIQTSPDLRGQYSAISFDKLLDLLIQSNMEEANRMEDKKEEIIALWKSKIAKQPIF